MNMTVNMTVNKASQGLVGQNQGELLAPKIGIMSNSGQFY